MRLGPVPAGLHLVLEDVVDRRHHADEEGVLAAHGGHRRPPCLDVDGLLDDVVEVEGHVVEDVAEALRHEPQVGGLPPDEQVQRRVEEVHADVVAGGGAGAAAAAAAAGHAEVALLAEVGAPGGVVLEELPADAAGDGEVEDVDGVVLGESRRGAELRVGEEEHQVLPLVPDVVRLEPEGGAEPVEDVGAVRVPDAGQRRRREVRRVRQRLHRRPHLRHLQRRVVPVHHHVLNRDDVVRRLHHRLLPRTRRRRRRRGAAVPQQAHLPVSRSQLQKNHSTSVSPLKRRSTGDDGRSLGGNHMLRSWFIRAAAFVRLFDLLVSFGLGRSEACVIASTVCIILAA